MDTREPVAYVELRCHGCGSGFRRRAGLLRQQRERGRTRFYCSHTCGNRSMWAERVAARRSRLAITRT